MREEYLQYVREYSNRLQPFMDSLQQMSYWKLEKLRQVEDYSFKKDGLVFVFRILSQGFPSYDEVQPEKTYKIEAFEEK